MFEELAAIIGDAGARALCAAYGGTRLYIPKSGRSSKLEACGIAPYGVAALSAIYGGETISPPTLRAGRLAARDVAIRARRDQNATVEELAREFGMTARQIYNVLKGKP